MSVILRRATHGDIEFLWYLRNCPDVYQYFKHPEPVLWEDHVRWIMQYLLGLRAGELHIISYEDVSTGQVRLDYEKKEAIVSISLLKEFRGKGIASRAVEIARDLVKRQGRVDQLVAEIHKNNTASVKLFEKLGFVYEGDDGDTLKFVCTI